MTPSARAAGIRWWVVATLTSCLLGWGAVAEARRTALPGGSGLIPALDADEQALWQRLCFRVEDAFDSSRGGFVTRQGILSESAVDLAFLMGRRERQERWRGYGTLTVQWMLGLEDSVGGGFFARAEPSPGQGMFERPTALNAHRLENLVDAWEATNDTRYWVASARLLEFAERTVVDGRGGFAADPVGDQDLVPAVNGMAIHAWLRWWAAARDPKRRDFALKSIERVWETSWNDSLGFVRMSSFGDLMAWPQLADQVEMGRALVLSAQLAGRKQDLVRARQVADVMIARFRGAKGTLRDETPLRDRRFTRGPGSSFKDNGRAALFLAELAHVAQDVRYFDVARGLWRGFSKDADKARLDAADWALALDAAIAPVFPKRPADSGRSPDRPRLPQKTTGKSRLGLPETKIGAEEPR